MTNDVEMKNRAWEVASIIKLVSSLNINAVCAVALNLHNNFSSDDIESLSDELIYDEYCKRGGETA